MSGDTPNKVNIYV